MSSDEPFKVVIIGETGVGKTSIISQFIYQKYEENMRSSEGGTFTSKTFIYGKNKLLKFEIWDTAGQERYRSLTSLFFKDANAAIFVYDITRKDSFEQIKEYWVAKVKECAPPNVLLTICANKSDLYGEEAVDEEEARKYAQEIGAIFSLTSAKNYYGINELFLKIAEKHTKCKDIKIMNEENSISTLDLVDSSQSLNSSKHGALSLSSKKTKKKKCC